VCLCFFGFFFLCEYCMFVFYVMFPCVCVCVCVSVLLFLCGVCVRVILFCVVYVCM